MGCTQSSACGPTTRDRPVRPGSVQEKYGAGHFDAIESEKQGPTAFGSPSSTAILHQAPPGPQEPARVISSEPVVSITPPHKPNDEGKGGDGPSGQQTSGQQPQALPSVTPRGPGLPPSFAGMPASPAPINTPIPAVAPPVAVAVASASRPLSPEEARALSPADLRELCLKSLHLAGQGLRKVDGTGVLPVPEAHAFNVARAVKAGLGTQHLSPAQLRDVLKAAAQSAAAQPQPPQPTQHEASSQVARALAFSDSKAPLSDDAKPKEEKLVGGQGDEEGEEFEEEDGDDDEEEADCDGGDEPDRRTAPPVATRASRSTVDLVKDRLREVRLGQRTPAVLAMSNFQDRYTQLRLRTLSGTTSIAIVEQDQSEALAGGLTGAGAGGGRSSVVAEATRLGLLRPNDAVLRYEDSAAVLNPRVGRGNAAAIERAVATGEILSPDCLVHVQLDHAVECQSTSNAVRRAFAAHVPVPDWAADALATGATGVIRTYEAGNTGGGSGAGLSPLMADFLAPLVPLQNGDDNLNVCPRALNGSKGKAVSAFLNRYGSKSEMPLRAVLLQDLSGRDRFNAKLAHNVAAVMGEASDALIPAIAEVKAFHRNVGGNPDATTLSFTGLYRSVSEELDAQITAMDLDRDGDGRGGGGIASRTRRSGGKGRT